MEEIIANPSLPQAEQAELETLEATFIWKDLTVYRELHSLLLQGCLDDAQHLARRVHSAVLHEKGAAHMFVRGERSGFPEWPGSFPKLSSGTKAPPRMI
jgi:hypothetical protein